jgi:NADH:ubiquinone oxidoreductase subunit 6 (subunit J)
VRETAFAILSAALLASALGVVTARSLFRAAFALAGALVATAGFYLLLAAPLLAAVQILLYTGGVLTLTVFALVVVGSPSAGARWRRPVPAAILAAAVFAALAAAALAAPAAPVTGAPPPTTAAATLLFRDYVVPFELLSVLLLGAVFGALLLARKDRPE